MLLTTSAALLVGPTVSFTFTVPGHQQWSLRSVRAVAYRDVGGLPNRAYDLTVTDGTNTVAATAAADAGTEPGLCSVTWANVPAAAVSSGPDGVVVAPIGTLVLPAGYTITGTITAPAAADTWLQAIAWYDYVDVTGP